MYSRKTYEIRIYVYETDGRKLGVHNFTSRYKATQYLREHWVDYPTKRVFHLEPDGSIWFTRTYKSDDRVYKYFEKTDLEAKRKHENRG